MNLEPYFPTPRCPHGRVIHEVGCKDCESQTEVQQETIDEMSIRLFQERSKEKDAQKPEQWIVCAAIRNSFGQIICGPRHFDQRMRDQIGISRNDWKSSEQGFVDQFGAFLTREEAHAIAAKNGQIRRRCGGDKNRLFSENLY